MLKTDLAYCAGIIDGEGCIRIKKTKAYRCQGRATHGYYAMVQIRMVDEAAIKFISETLGGWYYPEKPHNAQGKPLFCFAASDQKAENVVRRVMPFLRVRGELS